MKLLIKKERKKYLADFDRDVTVQKKETHLVKDTIKDFHTQFGVVEGRFFSSEDGAKVKVGNQEYSLLSPGFIDLYLNINRLAQIIPLKDIGSIITFTGLNKESRVIDAGSGSGGLALFLAGIAKEVKTYDVKDENIELVKKNIDFLGLKNIDIENKDIYDSSEIDDKEMDVFTLDVPEPWKAVDTAEKVLKIGGFLVCYSPCVPPLSEFLEAVSKKECFNIMKTIEIIERDWEFDSRKVRPKSSQIGHSGFLSFVRKI
ncbi:methyltransferase domain-containing protein [Candidatus Woesearchaeota archaeon]|nr:methyltransferase domain-containing protein [Candidatus Woesearchaeota archaeon]